MTVSNKLLLTLTILLTYPLVLVSPVKAASASFKFSPSEQTITTNTPFKVAIVVDPAGYSIGGAGSIILYDPQVINVLSIDPGPIFVDYPIAAIDNTHGKLTISGIASSDHFITDQGVFATITVVTKDLGNSKMSFLFSPGATTDSNIAISTGNGDILSNTNELYIKTVTSISPYDSPLVQIGAQLTLLKARVVSLVTPIKKAIPMLNSVRTPATVKDPLGPIEKRPSITDPSPSQPQVNIVTTQSNTFRLIQSTIIVLVFSLVIFGIWAIIQRLRN